MDAPPTDLELHDSRQACSGSLPPGVPAAGAIGSSAPSSAAQDGWRRVSGDWGREPTQAAAWGHASSWVLILLRHRAHLIVRARLARSVVPVCSSSSSSKGASSGPWRKHAPILRFLCCQLVHQALRIELATAWQPAECGACLNSRSPSTPQTASPACGVDASCARPVDEPSGAASHAPRRRWSTECICVHPKHAPQCVTACACVQERRRGRLSPSCWWWRWWRRRRVLIETWLIFGDICSADSA